jgi:cell division protein FtsB
MILSGNASILLSLQSFFKPAKEEDTMRNARRFCLPIAVVYLLTFFAVNAWGGEKIAVVQYELKPIASVDSGRYIKTEWNAKIRNRASEAVKFSVTILFVDSNNETLKETTKQCELKAQQTKSFTDTVLVESSVANKIASTRVQLKETADTDAASP